MTAGVEMLHATMAASGRKLLYSKGRWVSNIWRVPLDAPAPAGWQDAEQLTSENAFIEFVDVSRDGRRLLYSSDRVGNQDLWTMTIGGAAQRLTTDPAPDWAPRWSPDEQQIAFYSSRTGDREIWTMPAGGGPARQVTFSKGLDATPDWSPDGEQIAFRSERTGSSDIWIARADGSGARVIAPHALSEYAPSWSPDGRWIAFGSDRGGSRGIWRVSPSGGEPEMLAQGSSFTIRYAARTGEILYVGSGNRSGNIWAISPGDRRERPITNLRGRRGVLGGQPVAADDRFVYFTWRDDVGDIWAMDVVREDADTPDTSK
jgi:Tol biopolymer transport system component